MYIEIGVSVLLSIGFALYGARLCMLRTQSGEETLKDNARELAKVNRIFFFTTCKHIYSFTITYILYYTHTSYYYYTHSYFFFWLASRLAVYASHTIGR